MPTLTLRARSWFPLSAVKVICTAIAVGSLAGCQLLESAASSSVLPDNSTLRVKGIAQSSYIGKNPAGMSLIEANNFHDLLFTLGFSHANERLTQMVQLRLLAQGRLAEMQGAEALNLDRLMRSINLQADAQTLYKNAPKNLQNYFEIYARGVNAYLYQMRNTLPPELARVNYMPEYWQATDSALLFALLSLSQSGNLAEEVLALGLAQHLDAEKLPWLLPVYPDEPVASNEADKLLKAPRAAIKNRALRDSTVQLLDTLNQFAAVNSMQAPLASSWVASAKHTTTRRSVLALTTLHSQAQQPTLYSWVSLHSPQLQAAGLSIPGIPLLLSGFNGKLAYSLSAVMADTQDVFIEQLRQHNGRLEYLVDTTWQPAQQRMETFFIKGQQPIREALYRTAHGPLLTSLPANSNTGFGLALQQARTDNDQSLQALLQLLRSSSVEQATQALPKLNSLPMNVLLADAEHIAWQVTGTYPNRRNSRGLFPSAGWDSAIAWEGYADSMLFPYDQDPQQGWLSAANQRLTQPGYGMQLSSSWANPERAENLALQLAKKPVSANAALQDPTQQRPWLLAQLQLMLNGAAMPSALAQAIHDMPATQRSAAQHTLQEFLAINPQQPLSKTHSDWLNGLLQQAQEQLFKQDLSALPHSIQQAFTLHNQHSYPAWLDHILGRADSPFWQGSSVSKAQFMLDNLISSRSATPVATTYTSAHKSQMLLVDFARSTPVSAASFSSQTDNPHSPYYTLDSSVAGRLYPLPIIYKDINAVYGKQRLTLLPIP